MGTMKLIMMDNESLSYCIISSLKKNDKDTKLIQLFMWLNLVSTKRLGSNTSDMVKNITIEKLNVKNKKTKDAHRGKQDARKISLN